MVDPDRIEIAEQHDEADIHKEEAGGAMGLDEPLLNLQNPGGIGAVPAGHQPGTEQKPQPQ